MSDGSDTTFLYHVRVDLSIKKVQTNGQNDFVIRDDFFFNIHWKKANHLVFDY